MNQAIPPVINLTGELVSLGPWCREQLPLATRWFNDFSTMRTMGVAPGPVTLEQEEDWFDSVQKSETDILFVIYDRTTLRPIGSTGLHKINWRHRTADFGIIIGESSYRGRGYGTETTTLILDYAFRVLGLLNVFLQVVAINEAGIRAYERAGFREIGRRREAWFVEGERYDMVLMDCVPEDAEPGR
jgi:RimJ/RimL family protein N-acetyltransferase